MRILKMAIYIFIVDMLSMSGIKLTAITVLIAGILELLVGSHTEGTFT